MKLRLNKYLSICGVSSRRNADVLIKMGHISINGEVASLGHTIDPEKDKIRVRGKLINPERKRYILLNKPKLFITAIGEGQDDKRTIQELLTKIPERVYPTGRLDYDVEGLLLLTNDGELANRVSHPSFELTKVYTAVVKGRVSEEKCLRMQDGVELEDGFALPDSVKLLKADATSSILEISFHEGRNHIVKRFFAEFKHPVRQLRRISIGPLNIGNLDRGKWRDLTSRELKSLRKALELES